MRRRSSGRQVWTCKPRPNGPCSDTGFRHADMRIAMPNRPMNSVWMKTRSLKVAIRCKHKDPILTLRARRVQMISTL